ncbi:MAG: DUF4097 family beta strand repeat-containing protein, partial [Acidobacteriota bacterium]|nr:DUF4097 family beta strand repeat-containing protein [Acidobacteriota bacterium]
MRILLALSGALLLTGCIMGDFGSSDRYQTDFHYTFDLAPGGQVSVDNINGSVEISGWDEAKVDVAGTKYASTEQRRDDIKIEAQNSPTELRLRTSQPSSAFGGMGARYTIHVPRSIRVDQITTSNGGIRIHEVASASHLKSSNGSIRVEKVTGDVNARTSNGSIEMEEVRGNLTIRSSNGRIRLDDVEGNCEAETSNNSISVHLQHAPSGPLRLVTSNGSIDLTLAEPPKSAIRLETRNGGLAIHLPTGTSAHVEAETSNSGISSDFDVMTRSGSTTGKNHLDGDIGSGGPTIDLKTSTGH